MRLIDADKLIPEMRTAATDREIGVFPIMIGFDAIKKVIDEQPTIDAVPVEWVKEMPTVDAVSVVRCKDCVWFKTNHTWSGREYKVCVREAYEPMREDEDYCSGGRRREDADE